MLPSFDQFSNLSLILKPINPVVLLDAFPVFIAVLLLLGDVFRIFSEFKVSIMFAASFIFFVRVGHLALASCPYFILTLEKNLSLFATGK
jgi:hypothetical protein